MSQPVFSLNQKRRKQPGLASAINISLSVHMQREYRQELCNHIARLFNYRDLSFSDEEIITIYLFENMSGSRVKD